MSTFDLFEIREAGTVSIVRFVQQIDDFSHRTSDLHEQLARFVGDCECLKLTIDLRETSYLPSSVLGVLVQLRNHGCEVHLANASDDVVEVMQVTQLIRLIHVNETEVSLWVDDVGAVAEVVPVSVAGYLVICPECRHEVDTDKQNLGKRQTCGQCSHEFSLTAELVSEATHLLANCPACRGRLQLSRDHLKQPIQCPHCGTGTEVRMFV